MANWAIIVGINEYRGLPESDWLHGAVADASDFADWALHPQGGAVDADKAFIWTFPAPPATPTEPHGAMSLSAPWPDLGSVPSATRAPDATRPPDAVDIVALVEMVKDLAYAAPGPHRIYVFFAGHGIQITGRDGETCFVVGDYKGVANFGLIPCDALRGTLQTTGFEEVVLFLDCCRTLINWRGQAPNVFVDGAGHQVRYAVGRAAERQKMAFEFPAQPPKRGAFTKALTEALRRKRDANGGLTLGDLELYVQGRVPGLLGSDLQLPQFEPDPRPWPHPLITGPAIDPVSRVVIPGVPAGVRLQLFDSNDAPVGPPQPAAVDGYIRFDAAVVGDMYSVRRDTGEVLKNFRHEGEAPLDVF